MSTGLTRESPGNNYKLGIKMNIFILCTGRCGSHTFIKACKHINNYTSSHESRSPLLGNNRLKYPQNHIEADNRLSWFLGRLDEIYGDNAVYVHLVRNRTHTGQSLSRYMHMGIMKAYTNGILKRSSYRNDPLEISLDYYDNVNKNINAFLKDKTHKMIFTLENASKDYRIFWDLIGAEGDLEAALQEWERQYNPSRKMVVIEGLKRKFRWLADRFKKPLEKDYPSISQE
jgi:hypothetical protein